MMSQPCPSHPDCPECGEELDFLDYVVDRVTYRILYTLYICHNEDCDAHGRVYSRAYSYDDRQGPLTTGDPSGHY